MDAQFAPAKVNLFLHVGARGADGYHPIQSLMAFADIGDELVASPAERFELSVDGPFAGDLDDAGENLVARARDRLLSALDFRPSPFRLRLTKTLPIASGLGGGSADAAAALRLISAMADADPHGDVVAATARALGSDVLACLFSKPALARARGEVLEPPPPLPNLDVVLVNPLIPSPTADVYRAYDLSPSPEGANAPASLRLRGVQDAVAFLRECRNDLEAPAVRLRPQIGEVLATLMAQPETLLARMSGSGATCFALCENPSAAEALAERLASLSPNWWVRRTVLAGSEGP
ncbi:MAG TPA: 4-(cytidine 5'-diphospho)-2-C-methyl-D-erythritol kinase [Caulobacteraceae bacterium]